MVAAILRVPNAADVDLAGQQWAADDAGDERVWIPADHPETVGGEQLPTV